MFSGIFLLFEKLVSLYKNQLKMFFDLYIR